MFGDGMAARAERVLNGVEVASCQGLPGIIFARHHLCQASSLRRRERSQRRQIFLGLLVQFLASRIAVEVMANKRDNLRLGHFIGGLHRDGVGAVRVFFKSFFQFAFGFPWTKDED